LHLFVGVFFGLVFLTDGGDGRAKEEGLQFGGGLRRRSGG